MRLVRAWTGWRIWIIAPLLLLLASMCSHKGPVSDSPDITMVYPVDAQTVSDTEIVRITATDKDGIARVEIYVDNALRGTITTPPYEFKWDCTFLQDESSHRIRAKAYDHPGDTATTPGVEVVAHNPRTQPRGMGLVPLPGNVYNEIPVVPPPVIGSIPAKIDLSPDMPPIGDQGLQASSVGWAAGYALKSYLECKEGGGDCRYVGLSDKFSPAYIYNQIKSAGPLSAGTTSGACEQGGSLDAALELLRTQGCATLWTMPYDPDDCFRTPSPAADSEAAKYRIRSWGRVEFLNVDAIKRHLAGGYPVLIGFEVYENFFSLPAGGIYSLGSGSPLGAQAACVVGYDDSPAKRAFKIYNSWGTGWSENGYGWISYSFFPQVCTEAYTVVDSLEGESGCIVVTTNHVNATFTVARVGGGASYTGDGTSWSVDSVPLGSYKITYGTVSGFSTPPESTATLSAGRCITFVGSYQCVSSSPLPAPARVSPLAGDLCLPDRDTLIWTNVTDPSCGGVVKYDVYFGATNPPPKVDSNRIETWYPVAGLSLATPYYWKIVAKGTHNRETSGGDWTFTTGCWTALPVPGTPHPANNATCQSTTDTLTWTAVTDPCGKTVTYDVYFGTDNPPPKFDSGLTVNSFVRSGLTPNTPYYWKVDVRSDCSRRTAGTVWSFAPACKTSLPAPNNPTPATSATGQPPTVTLIWSNITDPCGGTVVYDVYFGTADPLPRVAPGLGNNSYLVSNLLSNQKYYWKVCVKAPCRDSVFGPKWDFTTSCTSPLTAPSAVSPLDNATCTSLTDTLRWTAVTDTCGPVTYDVFLGTTLVCSGLSTTACPMTGLTSNTKYTWKVCVKGTGGRQTCGSLWAFTTKCTTTLPTPAGPTPPDSAESQPASLTVSWNAVSDPCGGAVTYDVYAEALNPPAHLAASGLTSNSYNLTGMPDGTIYWKVRVNGTCDRHKDGPVWRFTVGCKTPLPPPSGPDPEDGATGQPTSLTLHWAAITDPCGDTVKYDVYFGTAASPPLVASNLRNNWHALTGLSSSTKYYWRIVAKGTDDRSTAGSVWNFTTVCPALAAATGANPADGAVCNALVDTLTWSAVTDPCGPVTYDLYFGTINPPPKLGSDLTVARYAPGALSANTKYYWKVCAKGTDSRQTCGGVWTLTTGCPKSLAVPTQLSPLNNATGRPTADTLSWAAVTDSCGNPVVYDVYFGATNPPPLADSGWTSTKYPVHGLDTYKSFYWKVCARGQGGCRTCNAAVWKFTTGCPALTVPSGPTPANHATNQPVTLNLQWVRSFDSCGGEITYDVYFDSISPPVQVASGMVSNFYSVVGLKTNSHYFWKVIAYGSNGRATPSSLWDFTTTCPDLLPTPGVPSPADSSGCLAKPDTLRWTAVTDPCGDALTYDVYFGKTNPPAKVDSGLTVTKYHPTGLTDTTKYYWKVCAKGTRSRQTCSKVWIFTTKCPKPLSAPSDPAPADSADAQPTTDTLRWDAVTDSCGISVTYDVYLGDAYPPPLVSSSRATNSYPATLAANKKYYWKICARGSGGCVTCSEVWVFNTGCPLPAPGSPSPSSGATCQSRKPTLSWGNVIDSCLNPVKYDVYVDTLNPPVVKTDSNLNVNFIVTDSLDANRKYYWKVCVKGTGGLTTCGPVWDFTVGCPTALLAPANLSPVNDTTCMPTTDTLEWDSVSEPCGGTVKYDVYFGTTNPPPKVDSNRTTLTYPKTGLAINTKYYWKISVKGPGGCQTNSPVWNFATVCTRGLAQVTLLKPSSDSTCTPFDSMHLSWSKVVDTCGSPLKYDLLYDTDTSVVPLQSDLDSSSATLYNLLDNQIYYWQVRARGTCGRVTYSPKWHFTTACTTSLPLPSDPDPGDGVTGTPVNDTLTWTTVVDPCGGAVTYDVYFGTANPPPKVTTVSTNQYLPTMAAGTKYYWKVVAKGTCGRSRIGPVWSFTTGP